MCQFHIVYAFYMPDSLSRIYSDFMHIIYGTLEGKFLFQHLDLPEKKLKQKELEKKAKQIISRLNDYWAE